MTTYIPIQSALDVLTMMRSQRLSASRRERIEKAIQDFRRAQVDPEFMAYLHTPLSERKLEKPMSPVKRTNSVKSMRVHKSAVIHFLTHYPEDMPKILPEFAGTPEEAIKWFEEQTGTWLVDGVLVDDEEGGA